MGISRDHWHKRKNTGGRMIKIRKKRKYELGRPPANTRLGPRRVHTVRTMGGNTKYRAMRLDHGNFSWGSEAFSRKTRVIDVVYCASNNEFVRTKTLVKGAVVTIDASPYRQWYENFYAKPLGRKKGTKLNPEEAAQFERKSKKKKYSTRQTTSKLDQILEDEFVSGRLLAKVASSPGQCGRVDGYILEGKELEFYTRKLRAKKK